MTDDKNDNNNSHLAPYPNLARLIKAAMDANGLSAKDVIDAINEHNRKTRAKGKKLATIVAPTLSYILNGQSATPAASTLRSLCTVLRLNPRAVWMAAGVSYGAIDGNVNSIGDCACSLSTLTIVVEVEGNELDPDEVTRLRRVATEAIRAELAKPPKRRG
jgi:transcriptional regulator with XRE-family HTH domain